MLLTKVKREKEEGEKEKEVKRRESDRRTDRDQYFLNALEKYTNLYKSRVVLVYCLLVGMS